MPEIAREIARSDMSTLLNSHEAYASTALAHRQMGATRPVASLIAILAGGIIALLLIPQTDWEMPGALRASGIAMSAGLLFSVVLATFRNPIALFRAELIIMFGLVYWLVFDLIQIRYALNVDRIGVVLVFMGITTFSVMFWIGSAAASAFGRPQPSFRAMANDVGPGFMFWAAVACALMGLSYKTLSCHFLPSCLYEGLMTPRFTPWALDPSFSFLKRLRPAGYLALPLTIAYFMLERRLTWRGVIVTILAFLNVLLLLMDGRRAMGTTVGAGILIYVLLQPRITLRHLMSLLGAAAFLLLVLEAMLAWRDYGIGSAFAEGRPIDTRASVISVDKNFYHCSRAMALVPEIHPHTGWYGLALNFGRVIPQSIWRQPGKFGFDYIGASGRRGRPGWTATFSIIGSLWVIGGFIALALGGLLYGVAANLTSRLLLRPVSFRSRLLYTAVVMAFFVSLRSLHELAVTGMGAVALFGLFLFRDWTLRHLTVPARRGIAMPITAAAAGPVGRHRSASPV